MGRLSTSIRLLSFFLAILCFPINGIAQWVSATGQAQIIEGDFEAARTKATRDAVKQALLVAGASVSSLQQVNNGIITQEYFQVRSDGEIRQIITESEQIEGDMIFVSLQVDIVPPVEQCQFAGYAKSLSLAKFTLAYREQATNGSLFHIGSEFSRRLYSELALMPHLFDTRQWIDAVLPFDPAKMVEKFDSDKNKLFALSQKNDSQFIMLGIIDDLSVHNENKRLKLFWMNKAPRNFSVRVFLFDGMTGEQLFTKQYKTRAPWPYDDTDIIDLSGAAFWQSQYGASITTLIDDIVIDLDQTLKCSQPLGRIVAIADDQVQINLGRQNGLKLGDRFNLYHNAGFIDQFGHIRSQMTNAHYEMKVDTLYEHNAILKPLEQFPMNNIQLNDMARLR